MPQIALSYFKNSLLTGYNLVASFSLTKVKKAIPLFQSKAKELVQLFDNESKSQQGVVDSKSGLKHSDSVGWYQVSPRHSSC